ncbi:hypothetical protein BBJ28_00022961, partial [Nothophytophthora sp. Chile5]
MTATTHLTRWAVKEPDGGGSQAADDLEESPATALAAARKAKARGGAPVERPLRLASYNGVFHQVVTAAMDAESAIKTWSAETGDEISSFARGHSDSPVTAIAFDHAGRRLLTGAHDGEQLKMWNFSNGALVKQFLKKEPPLLSSLLSSPPTVAATLLDDPSALAVGAGEASVAAATAGPPRKRKVRDIMLLPSSFGMDHEGHRGDPAIMASAELPSPTRTRLLRGQDYPTPVPPIMPQHPDAASQTARDPSPRPRSLVPRSLKTSRTTETSRYRQQEITSILDIERNLRVGMGDFICQRFVCSVGWDRRLYVWADKNDESEALPVHILPSDSDEDEEDDRVPNHDDALERAGRRRRKRQHHTMDVLALVYLPPAYVATAGLDGQVLLWSLNSGELVALLYQSSGAIETLCYAEKLELLVAAGENGLLVCFDRSMTPQAELPLDVSTPQTPSSAPESSRSTSLEPITTIRCDKANTHLVSGDAAGCVKVWELRVARDHEGVELVLVCVWHLGGANPSSRTGAIGGSSTRLTASSRRVVCADFVENLTRVSELFLVLSCADGDVSLWTLDGIQVGSFGGRHRSWQLGKPATYAATQSCCDWSWLPQTGRRASFSMTKPVVLPTREELEAQAQDEDEMDESAKNDVDEDSLASPEITFFVKCGSIAALNGSGSEPRESFLLEDTMPKPGEVWICVSGHRSRAATQNVEHKQDGNEGKSDAASQSTDEVSGRVGRKSVALSTVAIMSRRRSPFSPLASSNEPKTLASLPFLKRKLAYASGEVTDLITVAKVTRGEISCWDGAASKPLGALKVLDLSDFVRKAGWTKHLLLSQFIGRAFLDSTCCLCFLFLQAKPDKKMYALVGADGKEHGLQPLNESMSIARHKLLAAFRSERRQSSAVTVASVPASPRRRSQISTSAVALPPEDRRTVSPGLDMSMTSLQAQMQTLGVADPALSELLASSTANPLASRGSTPEALALASSVGMGARTLPLIRPREKRVMGGLLPKRSSVRSRLDPAADVRRIHNPDDIPKNFRAVLQHKREHKDVGFGGILPHRGAPSTRFERLRQLDELFQTWHEQLRALFTWQAAAREQQGEPEAEEASMKKKKKKRYLDEADEFLDDPVGGVLSDDEPGEPSAVLSGRASSRRLRQCAKSLSDRDLDAKRRPRQRQLPLGPAVKTSARVHAVDNPAVAVRPPAMHICIMIVGTRGDVQPFLAIAKRLQLDGHRVRLATHAIYREFVMSHGVEFYPLGGDPKELAAYMVKTGGRLIPLKLETLQKDVPRNMLIIEEILRSTWPAVVAADPEGGGPGVLGEPFRAQAIISNPVTYGHIHVAEKLGVPLHIMFPQPWVPTVVFPHPLSNLPYQDKPQRRNYLSYKLVDLLMWEGTERLVN